MKRTNTKKLLTLLGLSFLSACSRSCNDPGPLPSPRSLAFEPTVSWTRTPPQLTLDWEKNPSDTVSIDVYRKTPADSAFTLVHEGLSPTTNHLAEPRVEAGRVYEYYIERSLSRDPHQSGTYVMTGIEIPFVEERGLALLVIEESAASALAKEIDRLERDLWGDGTESTRILVSNADDPPSVKAKIRAAYDTDPAHTRYVFLIGHVPVPYSGNNAADGHAYPSIGPVHRGAWAADLYYADMHTVYTDESADTRQNSYPPAEAINENIPGDGKFDQARAGPVEGPLLRGRKRLAPESHGHVDLALGRIDFHDMPAFAPKSEIDLLRQYLDKAHAYRLNELTAEPRALIDDHFGFMPSPSDKRPGDSRASFAYDSFAAIVGRKAIVEKPWFDTLEREPMLLAYGAGPGQQTSSEGIGTTQDLARRDPKVLFTVLFGSYYGDYDHRDNFLRAQIATTTTLGTFWASHPFYLEPCALGKPIGEALRLSQNHAPFIHRAYLGDPTLALFVTPPVSKLSAERKDDRVELGWLPPKEPVLGYHVYRAEKEQGPFERLTAEPRKETSFLDEHPSSQGAYYMVRALQRKESPSGSFYHLSQGVVTRLAPKDASQVAAPR